jgi:hypothetical protein
VCAAILQITNAPGHFSAGGANKLVKQMQRRYRHAVRLRAAVDHEICFTLLVIWKYRRRGVACNMRINWIHFDRFEASRYRRQRRHCDGQQ